MRNDMQIEDLVGKLIAGTLGISVQSVHDDLAFSDIAEWDSLNHVNLLAAIEKEFGFEFTLTEMGGLKNVGDMLDLIQQIVSEK